MPEKVNQNMIMKVLNWSYDAAVNGLPGMDSAEEMADDYLKGQSTLREKVDSLIRWQNTKCVTSGFITGLGGGFTLPVAIPANISSVLYVQVRMIAAIAYMGGYDIRDDRVKSLVFACLCGSATIDVLKDTGIKVGTKLSEQALKKLSAELLKKINKAVGFRLVTKFGQTGVINLSKMLPLVGGVIGGTVDGFTSNTIGNIARDTFVC